MFPCEEELEEDSDGMKTQSVCRYVSHLLLYELRSSINGRGSG